MTLELDPHLVKAAGIITYAIFHILAGVRVHRLDMPYLKEIKLSTGKCVCLLLFRILWVLPLELFLRSLELIGLLLSPFIITIVHLAADKKIPFSEFLPDQKLFTPTHCPALHDSENTIIGYLVLTCAAIIVTAIWMAPAH